MRQDRTGRPPAEWCATPNAMRLNRLVRMSRRDVLLGGLGLSVAGLLSPAQADTQAPAEKDSEVGRFMAVSQRLTDRDVLDSRIGTALYAGIVHANPTARPRCRRSIHCLKTANPPPQRTLPVQQSMQTPPLKTLFMKF